LERLSDEIKTILTKLKLKKLFSAIVLRYDKETFMMINLIDSYITWGYVNKKLITQLVQKRAAFRGKDEKIAELDNNIIETHLGKFNVLCLEDIIYELSKCGKHFNDVMNFLEYFLLSPTEEIQSQVNIPFYKGGQHGFRGDNINVLLKKMI
jgi:large subunit ribosomal protein L7e